MRMGLRTILQCDIADLTHAKLFQLDEDQVNGHKTIMSIQNICGSDKEHKVSDKTQDPSSKEFVDLQNYKRYFTFNN